MTSTNDSDFPRETVEIPAVIVKSRSNSSDYTGGNVGLQNEGESLSSQSGGTSSGTKRRTKASRACDQCRKRKIRCDYGDDKGVCISCSKNGECCLFERIQLKRGPSKGTARGHSVTRSFSGENSTNNNSNNNNNNNDSANNNSGYGGPSPSPGQGSVLLPPLAPLGQYLPQPTPNVSRQQFWKVPYHEFQGQRRGSIDSLSSDMSIKIINTPQDQMMYNTLSTGHPFQTPTTVGSSNGGSTEVGQWPFRTSGGEDIDSARRRSGSNPPSFRNSSTSSQLQPQLHPQLHPQPQTNFYPQLSQQQQQQQLKQPCNNTFGQYSANGFPSRQGSIVSDGISPSAPALYSGNNGSQQPGSRPIQWPKIIQDQNSFTPIKSHPQNEGSVGSPSQKSAKRRRTGSFFEEKEKNQRVSDELASNRNNDAHSVSSAGFVYGQIPEIRLIDTYYEFIHMGFPIIPLNKETVTNEILLVNTQPISTIHEINNYVILWFRNSLELLVRISLKRKSGYFYDSLIHTREREFGNESARDTAEETLEVQNVFVAALNECLQKIVDIHPSFRENRNEISPKIKVIYLSTFILLNYILAVVGYDNSFVLGMSVTIFKDFKIYELLLYDGGDVDGNDDNDRFNLNSNAINTNFPNDESRNDSSTSHRKIMEDANLHQKGYSIMFKRLYVLLIIFDSLQCCSYGGPKLLNVPIEGASERFFKSNPNSDAKWVVDENSVRMKCILQSVKFGELLSEFSMNRRSICDISCKQLIWTPAEYFTQHEEKHDEFTSLAQVFGALLLSKQAFINDLLSLEDFRTAESRPVNLEVCAHLTSSLCRLASLILQVLTFMMRTNPKNCIDYNYRPARHLHGQQGPAMASTQETVAAAAAATTPATANVASSGHTHTAGNDFYQKLLGLQGGGDSGFTNFMRGTVSPFCIPLLREVRNITELVKHVPATLIGVVMTCAGVNQNANADPLAANAKSQELVVKLSNCMNDMMQITSLLNMIKPAKLFDQESDIDTAKLPKPQNVASVMQRLYYFKNGRKKRKKTEQWPEQAAGESVLQQFVLIGWKLLEDFELGWF